MNACFIIAEAGVNHNGHIGTAMKMIDAAKDAGADAVKFQTFDTTSLASVYTPMAKYQRTGRNKRETQFEMLKALELDETAHKRLLRHCQRKKIKFLSSPFDLRSIDLLERLGLDIFKIPSGEITNIPYLKK